MGSPLPQKIAFIDLETTGAKINFDRIIEVGILRIENNKIQKKYSQLVNPNKSVPPEIEILTGINNQDLENAPTFRQIQDEILELIKDCVIVAHNVRFDYSFLKSEFRNLGLSFSSKHFCTVKLSRKLYPEHRHHNLDSLIERYNFKCKNRHRAYDDAEVLWKFYQKVIKDFGTEKISGILKDFLKKPSLPPKISEETIASIPECAGVYTFFGANNTPLYIGKSIDLKNRVLSHFSSDITSSKEMKISQQVEAIEIITTAGDLGACLKESRLIKTHKPPYNRMLKHSRGMLVLKENKTKEGFKTVKAEIMDVIHPGDLEQILGIFKSKRNIQEFLAGISKEYNLCEKLLGVDSSAGACFGYRLGKCQGACIGKEKIYVYNLRFIEAFLNTKIKPWPFFGPIAVTETDIFAGLSETFLINKWCLLGTIRNEGGEKVSLEDNIFFDLDTYKLLCRYVFSSTNQSKIKQLTGEQLQFLTGKEQFYEPVID